MLSNHPFFSSHSYFKRTQFMNDEPTVLNRLKRLREIVGPSKRKNTAKILSPVSSPEKSNNNKKKVDQSAYFRVKKAKPARKIRSYRRNLDPSLQELDDNFQLFLLEKKAASLNAKRKERFYFKLWYRAFGKAIIRRTKNPTLLESKPFCEYLHQYDLPYNIEQSTFNPPPTRINTPVKSSSPAIKVKGNANINEREKGKIDAAVKRIGYYKRTKQKKSQNEDENSTNTVSSETTVPTPDISIQTSAIDPKTPFPEINSDDSDEESLLRYTEMLLEKRKRVFAEAQRSQKNKEEGFARMKESETEIRASRLNNLNSDFMTRTKNTSFSPNSQNTTKSPMNDNNYQRKNRFHISSDEEFDIDELLKPKKSKVVIEDDGDTSDDLDLMNPLHIPANLKESNPKLSSYKLTQSSDEEIFIPQPTQSPAPQPRYNKFSESDSEEMKPETPRRSKFSLSDSSSDDFMIRSKSPTVLRNMSPPNPLNLSNNTEIIKPPNFKDEISDSTELGEFVIPDILKHNSIVSDDADTDKSFSDA